MHKGRRGRLPRRGHAGRPGLRVVRPLAAGALHDASQSALLFTTSVAAVIATGTVVFLAYGVRAGAGIAGRPAVGVFRGRMLAAVSAVVLLVAVPLTAGSVSIAQDRALAADTRPVAERWAAAGNWQIASVEARNGVVVVGVLGLPPQPAPTALRAALDQNGMRGAGLELHLVGGRTHWCPADGTTCTVRKSSRS
ncbi:hypothetical protein [Streptomyces atratus]|uniref:hypothetical protein n=1 Tax=Streptomyces atratus TaxID=1893 RepID=UPI0033F481AA